MSETFLLSCCAWSCLSVGRALALSYWCVVTFECVQVSYGCMQGPFERLQGSFKRLQGLFSV